MPPRRPARDSSVVTTAPVSAAAFDAFEQLRAKRINFQPLSWEQALDDPDWRIDQATRTLARERPGEPQPAVPSQGPGKRCSATNSPTRTSCSPSTTLTPLDGQNMLLVGRFLHLRFHMGVRIGGVIDTLAEDDNRRIRRFGWHYRTLEGHLEQGQMDYEIRKDTLRATSASMSTATPAPLPSTSHRPSRVRPLRQTQVRFYRNILDRMEDIAKRATAPQDS